MNTIPSSCSSSSREFQPEQSQSSFQATFANSRSSQNMSLEDLKEIPSIDSLISMQQTIMQENNLYGSRLGEHIISQLTQLTEQFQRNWICQFSDGTHSVHQMYDQIQSSISLPPNQQEQQWIKQDALYALQNKLRVLTENPEHLNSFQSKQKHFITLQCILSACIKQIQQSPLPHGHSDDLCTELTFALKKLINHLHLFYTRSFHEHDIITLFHSHSNLPHIYVILRTSPITLKTITGQKPALPMLILMQHFIQNFIQNGYNPASSASIPCNDLWQEIVQENPHLKKTMPYNPFNIYQMCINTYVADFFIKMHSLGVQTTALTYKSILLDLKRYLAESLRAFPLDMNDQQNIRNTFPALCGDNILSFIYPKVTIMTREQKIVLIHALHRIIMTNYKVEEAAYIYQCQYTHVQRFFQQYKQKANQEVKISACIEQLQKLLQKHHRQNADKGSHYNDLFKKFLLSTLYSAIISLENINSHSCAGLHQKVCQYTSEPKQTSTQRCIAYLHYEITVLHRYDVLLYLRSLNQSTVLPFYQLADNRQNIQKMITLLHKNRENLKHIEVLLWQAYQHSIHLKHIQFAHDFIKSRLQFRVPTCTQQQNLSSQKMQEIRQQKLLWQGMTNILLYMYEFLSLLRPNSDNTFYQNFFSSSCDSFTYIANMLSMKEKLPANIQITQNMCMQGLKDNSEARLQENTTSDDEQGEEKASCSIKKQEVPLLSDFPDFFCKSSSQEKDRPSQQSLPTIAASIVPNIRSDDHAQSQDNIASSSHDNKKIALQDAPSSSDENPHAIASLQQNAPFNSVAFWGRLYDKQYSSSPQKSK